MILYATKKTKERLHIPFYDDLKEDVKDIARAVFAKEEEQIFKWGLKIFYFDRRKCLQILNFASKFCVFLVDVKVKDLKKIGEMVAYYLQLIYNDDEEALKLLNCYFSESPISVFDAFKDKGAIASLNFNEEGFLQYGYRLYDYLEDGILQTIKLNKHYNLEYIAGRTVDGKKEYVVPGKEFKKILSDRYGKSL